MTEASSLVYDPEKVTGYLDKCHSTTRLLFELFGEQENFDFAAGIDLLKSRPQLVADAFMTAPNPEVQKLGSRYYNQIGTDHSSYKHIGRLLDPEALRNRRPIKVRDHDKNFGKHLKKFKENEIVSMLLKKRTDEVRAQATGNKGSAAAAAAQPLIAETTPTRTSAATNAAFIHRGNVSVNKLQAPPVAQFATPAAAPVPRGDDPFTELVKQLTISNIRTNDHIAATVNAMNNGFDTMRNIVDNSDRRHTYHINATNKIVGVQGRTLMQQQQQINLLATAEKMRLAGVDPGTDPDLTEAMRNLFGDTPMGVFDDVKFESLENDAWTDKVTCRLTISKNSGNEVNLQAHDEDGALHFQTSLSKTECAHDTDVVLLSIEEFEGKGGKYLFTFKTREESNEFMKKYQRLSA